VREHRQRWCLRCLLAATYFFWNASPSAAVKPRAISSAMPLSCVCMMLKHSSQVITPERVIGASLISQIGQIP
jgi:hypothetical protein